MSDGLISQLIDIVGEANVVSGKLLQERATSYWDSSPTHSKALVKPTTTEQVSQILALCHKQKQSVVIQGGLTGVVKGSDSSDADIALSLEKMNRIIDVDDKELVATVEAGVVLQTLQEAMAAKDLLFPLDLGARGSCTIGGNVATNAGGINVLRYGMMRNLVLGLEVVLMDGTVLSSMYPMLKNNTGYDLKQLFIGSEGTLGVVTKVLVRLFPRPTSCQTAMVAVDNFDTIINLLNRFRGQLAGSLSAFEVMWNNYYLGVTGEGGHKPPMSRDHPYYVIIEAEGFQAAEDTHRFQHLLETALNSGEITDAIIASSERERQSIWIVREEFEALLPAYLYDVSLPIRHMSDYATALEKRLKEESPGTKAVLFGHIADGNLHIFAGPYQSAAHYEQIDAIVYETLKPFRGSVSAEHGIGLSKKPWLVLNRSDDELNLMRILKNSLDAEGLLNPGRVV